MDGFKFMMVLTTECQGWLYAWTYRYVFISVVPLIVMCWLLLYTYMTTALLPPSNRPHLINQGFIMNNSIKVALNAIHVGWILCSQHIPSVGRRHNNIIPYHKHKHNILCFIAVQNKFYHNKFILLVVITECFRLQYSDFMIYFIIWLRWTLLYSYSLSYVWEHS